MDLEHKEDVDWVICCVMVAEETILHIQSISGGQCSGMMSRKLLAYPSRMHGRISEAVG